MTRDRLRPGALILLGAALLLGACGGDGTQNVRPQLVPPQDTTDFGAVPVLNQKTMNVDVLNVGRGALTVKRVAIQETDVPFQIVSQPTSDAPIGAGESQPVVVAFTPPLEQDYAATLVLETDDQDNPSVSVKLVGKGSTRAIMEVDPASLDFGRVAEGRSAVKTLTIRSRGSADLILNDISFQSNTGAFEFLGSVKTPVVVPHVQENGLPGEIKITVRYTVEEGAPDSSTAVIHVAGTDPDNQEVQIPVTGTVNRAPIAVIAPLGVGAPGMEVTLDGSMSSDPDNDLPLTYKWTLTKPRGAVTEIEGPEQPTTHMTLDPTVPGSYVVELNVTDSAGAKNIHSAKATIVAAPAEKLLIEMFWDNTQTDVDLHLLKDPTQQVEAAPGDCFYQNPTPDWGMVGDSTDDPAFKRDALVGYGPEVIGYTNPPDGSKFRVVALYQATHGAANPASKITVRIYEFGVVVFEQSHTLSTPGEVWPAADIDWPSGDITALQP